MLHVEMHCHILMVWSRFPTAKQPLFASPAKGCVNKRSVHTLHPLNLQYLILGECCQKQLKRCDKDSPSLTRTVVHFPFPTCWQTWRNIWHPHIASTRNRNAQVLCKVSKCKTLQHGPGPLVHAEKLQKWEVDLTASEV